jgi:hypothetical protein
MEESYAVSAPNRRFNLRGFASLASGMAFLLMAVSGVVLYVAPRGRVANWTDWTVLGMGKEEWSDLHMTAAILLLAAVALHIFFNWRTLLHYLRARKPMRRFRWRELGAAGLLTALVIAGTVGEFPPFRAVGEANTAIKNYWEKDEVSRETRAPSTRVQEADLQEFARWVGVSFADMLDAFEAAGYPVDDPTVSINELARQHRVSSRDLYELARSPRPNGTAEDRWVSAGIEETEMSRTGRGRGGGGGRGRASDRDYEY